MFKRAAIVLPGLDTIDHKARFIEFVERAVQRDRFTVDAVGPQLFTQTPVVVLNQGVSCAEDIVGRAVILLQTNGFCAREIGEEALDVFHLRPAPAVDRLVVITHDHHFTGIARQQADPGVLNVVGVLEFVHQDIGKAFAIVLQDMRFVEPQFMGAQ